MTLTTTALFLLAAVVLAIWMKKDPGFKRREFLAVSAFWILAVATPWGAAAVDQVQDFLGTGVKTASDTVNSVSTK